IPMLDQLPGRLAEQTTWSLVAATSSEHRLALPAPQDTAHAGSRARELGLEPASEGALEERARDVVGRHFEARIDSGLDRHLAQQIGAEGMDGADPRFFEPRQRLLEPLAGGGRTRGVEARAFDLGTEAKLELAGRRLGEGNRH